MSARKQRKNALIAEITAAFDGVSREGGVSLHETWVIDDYGTPEERAEARARDTEKRWQDVPDESIVSGFNGVPFLIFLDDIGLRYYVPACMVYGLRHMDGEDGKPLPYNFEANSGLTWVLLGSAHSTDEDVERDISRWNLFNLEQKRAIAHFLELMEEDTKQRVLEGRHQERDEHLNSDLTAEEIEEELLQDKERYLEHDRVYARIAATTGQYWKQFR